MREQIDLEILEKAKQAERKLKRLKMAKYSQDLFDEIIEEMMREKKTLMEMMAELDCDSSSSGTYKFHVLFYKYAHTLV